MWLIAFDLDETLIHNWSGKRLTAQQNSYLGEQSTDALIINRDKQRVHQSYWPLYSSLHRSFFRHLSLQKTNIELAFVSYGFLEEDHAAEFLIQIFGLKTAAEKELMTSAYYYNRYDLRRFTKASSMTDQQILAMCDSKHMPEQPQPALATKSPVPLQVAYSKLECIRGIMQASPDHYNFDQFNSNAFYIDDMPESRAILSPVCNVIDPTAVDYPIKLVEIIKSLEEKWADQSTSS